MKKILIVDDDADFRELIKNRLLYSGFEVFEAKNGLEGLERAKKVLPDLVILDIKMPQMNGYSLVKELRTLPETASVPIIVLTAYKDMQDLFKLEGVDEYVIKTEGSNSLLEKISKVLNVEIKKNFE